MRLLTWNINALAPTVRNAVLKYGSWQGFFEEHRLDIACLQESKVIEDKLTKELACVEGWQSFWAISRDKKGYSGVTTYAVEAWAPLSAEADCLPAAEGEEAGEEGEDLNREGRVVLTDHGAFVLINVYVPNAGDRPARARLAYKLRFLAALRRKCAELAAGGRELLIVGDFNIPAEPRDMHAALGPFEQHYSAEEVAALRALTDSYPDVWRRLHPDDAATFTVWNEKTSARAFNHGLRIDFVLATPGLAERVVSCEVLAAEAIPPKWSDHAGMILELRDTKPPPPHPPCAPWQRLHRRFNPPNRIADMFAAGRKRPAAAAAQERGGGSERAAQPGEEQAQQQAQQQLAQQQQQQAGEQQAGEQQQEENNGAHKKARTAADGCGSKSAQAAAETQSREQKPPDARQQKGSGGAKPGKSGGSKGKPAPEAGQRSIGSFFSKNKREDAAEDPPDSGVPPPADLGSCVHCRAAIEEDEERIEVQCSRCGPWRAHVECGCDYLDKHIRASNTNSSERNKYKVLVHKRPTYFFSSEGVPCPRRAGDGKQGDAPFGAAPGSKGSVIGKGKGTVVASGGCPGTCIGAEILKPAKQQPAAPPAQPARAAAAAAAPAKQPLPALAGVRREKGRPPSMPMGQPPAASRATALPHADLLTKRPDPLRGGGGGDRDIPGLAPASSGKGRKAKAAKAAAAAASEASEASDAAPPSGGGASASASVSEAGGGGGAGEQPAEAAVGACISALLDMGFEWEAAMEAAEVAGGDVEAATQMLLAGAVGGTGSAAGGPAGSGGAGAEVHADSAAYAQQEAADQRGWGSPADAALPSRLPAAASWAHDGAGEAPSQGGAPAAAAPQPATPLHAVQQHAAPSSLPFASPSGDSAYDAGFAAGLAAAGLATLPLQHKAAQWAAPAQEWAAVPAAAPAAEAEELDELLSLMGIS